MFTSSDDIKVISPLNTAKKGSIVSVFQIQHRRCPRLVLALKELHLDRMVGGDRALKKGIVDMAHKEVKITANMKDYNIIKVLCAFEEKNVLHILMEFMPKGTLAKRIRTRRGRNHEHFNETEVVKWLSQLAKALQYLHGKSILHRDVKSENIFFTADDSVKLGDFGLASASEHQQLMDLVSHMAPEILQHGKPYSDKAEVWAYGVVAYEIMSLKLPFQGERGLLCSILGHMKDETRIAPLPDEYSAELRYLVTEKLLSKDAGCRFTMQEVMAHPVIDDFIRTGKLSESVLSVPAVHISPDTAQLPTRRYKDHISIGKGSQGEVFRATQLSDGKQVVLKRVLLYCLEGNNKTWAIRETTRFVEFDHPNIVKFFGSFETKDQHQRDVLWLEMEFCEGLTLRKKIEDRSSLANSFFAEPPIPNLNLATFNEMQEIRPWIRQIASGLEYVHERRIVHRDVSPANILFKLENGQLVAKLADFGISKHVPEISESPPSTPTDTTHTGGREIGTFCYFGPEVFSFNPRNSDNFKRDVWALGVILYQLAMCDFVLPYKTKKDHKESDDVSMELENGNGDAPHQDDYRDVLKGQILKGDINDIPSSRGYSAGLNGLFKRMLDPNLEMRLSSSEVVAVIDKL